MGMFDRFKKLRFEHIRQKRTPNNKNFGGAFFFFFFFGGGRFLLGGRDYIYCIYTMCKHTYAWKYVHNYKANIYIYTYMDLK